MRVKEQIYEGEFWLHDSPEKKVIGKLMIERGGKVMLELAGALSDSAELSIGMPPFRVLGTVNQHGCVTLDQCLFTNYIEHFPGIPKTTINVGFLFCGVWYGKNEEVSFDNFIFSVDLLDEWLMRTGIKVVYKSGVVDIHYEPPCDVSFDIDEFKIDITQSGEAPGFPVITEAKVVHKNLFRIQTQTLMPFEYFVKLAYQVVRLIGFCAGHQVGIKNVSASNTGGIDQRLKKPIPINIEIFYRSNPYPVDAPNECHVFMPVTYNDIKDSFEKVLKLWIQAFETLSPPLGLFFSATSDRTYYNDSKFLSLAQALESFHRRTSDKVLWPKEEFKPIRKELVERCPKTYRERVGQCLSFAHEIPLLTRLIQMLKPMDGLVFENNEMERVAKWIRDTRNYLTHYDKSLEGKSAKGRDMLYLIEVMSLAFEIQMLKILGISDEGTGVLIADKQYFRRQRERVKELAPKSEE